MKSKWLTAMKRQNFVPSANSRICNEHFKKTDFTASKTRRRLKENAIPSVFKFPEHLQPKTQTKKKQWIGTCCVAFNCSNRQRKRSIAGSSNDTTDVTFHRFPSNIEIKSEWLTAMKRLDFVPSPNSRICSEHFKMTDFTVSKTRRRLKENAIPSIFKFPVHLQPKTITQRRKLSRLSPKKWLNVSRSIRLDHSYYCDPKTKKHYLKMHSNISKKQKTKIKQLKKNSCKLNNRSLQNRPLKDVIADLRNRTLH